jgi:hypothetical protein
MSIPIQVEARIPKVSVLEERYSCYALNFNGTNSVVTVPRSPSLEPTSQITIELWILFRSFIRPNVYFIHKYGAYIGYLIIRDSGTNTFKFYLGSGTWHTLNSVSTISLNKLYHVVATYDGNRQRIYLNGVLDAEGPVDTFTISPATASNLEIGAISSIMPTYNLDGWITGVRIHGVALTAEQVRQSFKRGYPRVESDCRLCLRISEGAGTVLNDLSGNGNNGTISNATWMRLKKHQLQSRTWQ